MDHLRGALSYSQKLKINQTSGCLGERIRQTVINLIGGFIVKGRMPPVVIIDTDPFGEAASQGQAVFKRVQVKVLILDGPP